MIAMLAHAVFPSSVRTWTYITHSSYAVYFAKLFGNAEDSIAICICCYPIKYSCCNSCHLARFIYACSMQALAFRGGALL